MKKLLPAALLLCLPLAAQGAEFPEADLHGVRYRIGLGLPFFDVQCSTTPTTCGNFVGATFSGATTFTGTLRVPNGSVSSPSYSFTSSPATGFFLNSTNVLDVAINTTDIVRINGSGLLVVGDAFGLFFGVNADLTLQRGGTNGALRIFGGTTPTQSGTTCGTGPTIVGNNTNGAVTLGTTPGLPCTIVFSGTWTTAPVCYLNPEVLTTGTTTVRATGITPTQFVITSTAALVATDKVSWHCESR